ncbi:condensation domain-containing protein [Brevibacillus sp. FSL K6-2834]|uniref:condensation domain-containing protein n=1 Tax=Brevibacillus sp. FSL K6-2834 TaxID=2954680 RepID=UPI003158E322
MIELDSRIHALSDRKKKLLEILLASQGTSLGSITSIRARTEPKNQEVATAAQIRVWKLHHEDPNQTVGNIPFAYRLKGRLNVPALIKSIEMIVQRHESLRTTFHLEEGQLYQVILGADEFQASLVDLREMSTEKQEEIVNQERIKEAKSPFDLSRMLPIRVKIIQLGEQDNILLLNFHHIVFDGWSMGIFFRELAAFYNAYSMGTEYSPSLPPLQYADYAAWEKQQKFEKERAYWRNIFHDLLTEPKITSPFNRPRKGEFRYGRVPFTIKKMLLEKVKIFSGREKVTLYMTLLTAFAAVLSKFTGKTDIVIGTPVAGRTRKEIEDLIGMFANISVLRLNWKGSVSFHDLLDIVRQVSAEAFAHQELPIEQLIDSLGLSVSPNCPPLFPFLFALQNAPSGGNEDLIGIDITTIRDKDDLHIRPILEFYSMPNNAKLDLSLVMSEREYGLVGLFEFNQTVLDFDTVSQFSHQFIAQLKQITEDL